MVLHHTEVVVRIVGKTFTMSRTGVTVAETVLLNRGQK
jgi:hypothetical protein